MEKIVPVVYALLLGGAFIVFEILYWRDFDRFCDEMRKDAEDFWRWRRRGLQISKNYFRELRKERKRQPNA